MNAVTECVICEGAIVRLRKGITAPFLARRIWQRLPFAVDLAQCCRCGFIFFNPRLEQHEEERLYAGYRGGDYQVTRYSCEPWYTRKFNERLTDPKYCAVRRRALAPVLARYLAKSQIQSILDFGGSRGELIRGLIPGVTEGVYDISGIEPLEGVRKYDTLEKCQAARSDLIICSNVLEHVGYPRRIMDQIRGITCPDKLAFIEVPCESPFESATMIKRIVQIGILGVTRPRIALSVLKPGGLYWMHEHVNFFGLDSLVALFQTTGWEIVASDVYAFPGIGATAKMAWCLGRPAEKSRSEKHVVSAVGIEPTTY